MYISLNHGCSSRVIQYPITNELLLKFNRKNRFIQSRKPITDFLDFFFSEIWLKNTIQESEFLYQFCFLNNRNISICFITHFEMFFFTNQDQKLNHIKRYQKARFVGLINNSASEH